MGRKGGGWEMFGTGGGGGWGGEIAFQKAVSLAFWAAGRTFRLWVLSGGFMLLVCVCVCLTVWDSPCEPRSFTA